MPAMAADLAKARQGEPMPTRGMPAPADRGQGGWKAPHGVVPYRPGRRLVAGFREPVSEELCGSRQSQRNAGRARGHGPLDAFIGDRQAVLRHRTDLSHQPQRD
jgi:hypothetical protein